jgi:hypothetical protein
VRDTRSDAATIQAAIHRTMGGDRKLALVCEMSSYVRDLALARIRATRPELSEAGARQELMRELYGYRRQR